MPKCTARPVGASRLGGRSYTLPVVDPIVVAGLPRSGTSWVGKALSFADGCTYFREPDNFDHVPGALASFRWTYLPADRRDGAFEQQLQRALRGEERHPTVMSEDPGPILARLPPRLRYHLGSRFPALYLTQGRVLVKLIFSNLALGWIASAVPNARLVPVLRHPCGTYASWRRLGWSPEPQRLLLDERLMEDHLGPFERAIAEADGYWERAGAEWGAVAVVLDRQAKAHPDWLVVQHEWLCQSPVERFADLYRALGLAPSTSAARFLTASDRSGDEAQRSLRRDSANEADKWKRSLDPADIAACRRVVERFELPWYPEFEPTPHVPTWQSAT